MVSSVDSVGGHTKSSRSTESVLPYIELLSFAHVRLLVLDEMDKLLSAGNDCERKLYDQHVLPEI